MQRPEEQNEWHHEEIHQNNSKEKHNAMRTKLRACSKLKGTRDMANFMECGRTGEKE